jgi:type IV pilus assembly protein PilB
MPFPSRLTDVFMIKQDDPIMAILKEERILKPMVLQSVLQEHERTGESIISILQRDKQLDEEQIARIAAAANGIEFIALSPDLIDPMVAHLVSHELANRHGAIPVKRTGESLMVAMISPMDLAARDEIELKTGYAVVPVAASPQAIRQALQHHFDVANATKQVIASMRLKKDPAAQAAEARKHERHYDSDDPISKLVSSIIQGAIVARASDIHIEPQSPDVRVRYRVDGTLRDAVRVPNSVQQEVVSHIKIMADMDISERRIPQDGHVTTEHEGHEYDLRVSSLPSVGGEKIVMRILDKTVDRWSLDRVVTSPQDNQVFRELARNPYGMLLLTGPTGCGKTTTLYSVLQLVNTPERNIVTVEDPVEYCLDGITQVQVKPVAGMTFPSALRSILRQDPDIILIGEIRDRETAEIAVGAALTGHLVLSTLHTNDAAGAVSRLTNLGIPPFLVGSALIGSVAQRLLRTCCPKCKRPYQATERERQILLGETPDTDEPQLWSGAGCNHCYQSGYIGRKSVYEILRVSRPIQRMIVSGTNDDAIKQAAMEEGMRTLKMAAAREVLDGQTTVEEVTRVIDVDRA